MYGFATRYVVHALTVFQPRRQFLLAGRVPDTIERVSRNDVGVPILVRAIEARLPPASVLIFLMSGPVAEDRPVVVRLNLPNGPAILTNLEVPDGVSPTVELVASWLIPATAAETTRHSESLD
jgi:hypothetical protein